MEYRKIQEIMDEKKLSKLEVCKVADISRPTLDGIINGKRIPSVDTLEKIAKALGISPAEFWSDRINNDYTLEKHNHASCRICKEKNELIKILQEDREILKKTNEALRRCMDHLPVEKKR